MGDWDRKSHRQVDLENQCVVLRIKNRRLQSINDDLYGFVASHPERASDWAMWLSRQPTKDLTEDEVRLRALEDLIVKTYGESNV
jgi:hypothetical protein